MKAEISFDHLKAEYIPEICMIERDAWHKDCCLLK